jgi:dTMP kinase
VALADRLGAVLTGEPGGTAVGARIRAIVLDPGVTQLADRAEALLMAADRAQHVEEIVRPALAAGTDVVTDRYSGSTLAYQGFGRRMDVDRLRALSGWAAGGLEPDLVVLLEVPPDVVAARLGGRVLDRMEREGTSFHDRVRAGYRTLAGADPARWRIVDGRGAVAEVHARVWAEFRAWDGTSG